MFDNITSGRELSKLLHSWKNVSLFPPYLFFPPTKHSLSHHHHISNTNMDPLLYQAILEGDLQAFQKLISQNPFFINQTTPDSSNTPLHLAARFGQAALVAEMVASWPELVAATNGEAETPLHEACREGHVAIVRVLREADLSAACKLNRRDESVMFVACERGRVEVVKELLNLPLLLTLEVDGVTTSLHAAAEGGHTGNVAYMGASGTCIWVILGTARNFYKYHETLHLL